MATILSIDLKREIPIVRSHSFLSVDVPEEGGSIVYVWCWIGKVKLRDPLQLDIEREEFVNLHKYYLRYQEELKEVARRISHRIEIRLPFNKLHMYLITAVMNARCDSMPDGSFYCEHSQISGVYAGGPSEQACRQKFEEVLMGWIIIELDNSKELPSLT